MAPAGAQGRVHGGIADHDEPIGPEPDLLQRGQDGVRHGGRQDDVLGSGGPQLVGDFPRGVRRVDGRGGRPGPGDAVEGRHVLRAGGQHDQDGVTGADTPVGQPGRHVINVMAQASVAELLTGAGADHGDPVGNLVAQPGEQVRVQADLGDVDVGQRTAERHADPP
jgi:hypothetical protein